MGVSRNPARPASGSPAYSPDDLPAYRGGGGAAPAAWNPDEVLAGVTNSFWRGSDGGLFQDAGLTTPASVTADPIGGVENQSSIGTVTVSQATTADKFELSADGRIFRNVSASSSKRLVSNMTPITIASGFCFACDVDFTAAPILIGGETRCQITASASNILVRVGGLTTRSVGRTGNRSRVIVTGNGTDFVIYIDGALAGTFATETDATVWPAPVLGTLTAAAVNGSSVTYGPILMAAKDLRADAAEIDAWMEANA